MRKRGVRKAGKLPVLILLLISVCIAFFIEKSRNFLFYVFHRFIDDPWIFIILIVMIVGGVLGFWYSRMNRKFGNHRFVYISNTYWLGIFPLPVPGTPTISLFILGIGFYFLLDLLELI